VSGFSFVDLPTDLDGSLALIVPGMKRPFVFGLAALTALAVLPFVPAAPAAAAFPGRNARIVFMRFGVANNNLGEIYSMTAAGGSLLNLTNTPLIEDRDPAWSPDGERIVFRRFNAGPDQLWVMNADGTGLSVVPGSGAARHPAWSPDGKRLVYECYESWPYAGHICLREVTGGGFTLLSAAPGVDDTRPSWSPDGTRIVWTRRFAGGSHLVVLTLKNLSLDALTPPVVGNYDDTPDWSPDSKQVVFSRDLSGVSGASIYRIAANGKGAAQLVVGPSVFDSYYTMPVWSPDGKQIAYVHIDDDESWGNIYTITPDGKDNTQLTFGGATDQNIDWGVA
jgi:Tol biopolymer transport system component